MSFLIGTSVLGIMFISIVFWTFRQWRLAREGVVTRGEILRKKSFLVRAGSEIYGRIHYKFLTPRGEYAENSVFVGEAVLHDCKEGSEIDVVYLRDNPAVNSAKQVVNLSRDLIKLPPL